MFIHILADDNDNRGFLPHQVVECDRVSWKRKTGPVENDDEFDFGDVYLDFCTESKQPLYIDMAVDTRERQFRFVVRGGDVYIMNDNGKTIEHIIGS
jgi:hypothetical protein